MEVDSKGRGGSSDEDGRVSRFPTAMRVVRQRNRDALRWRPTLRRTMPEFIIDTFDGETLAELRDIGYGDLPNDVLIGLALSGDDGAIQFMSDEIDRLVEDQLTADGHPDSRVDP